MYMHTLLNPYSSNSNSVFTLTLPFRFVYIAQQVYFTFEEKLSYWLETEPDSSAFCTSVITASHQGPCSLSLQNFSHQSPSKVKFPCIYTPLQEHILGAWS